MALLQQQLLRAQERMRRQADKHRVERVFAVGDMVYLKLQPYIQNSVARRSTQKLAFKFYGPYKILQRVGEVAYKLALPTGSRIHDVVHVSQLKRHLAPQQQVSGRLSFCHLLGIFVAAIGTCGVTHHSAWRCRS
jgi:ribosomal protein L21E